MSFLHPIILVAIPLIALPVLIHLLNLRRYKAEQWGAMMFLVQALRINRGHARLRHWTILALRMAAISGIVLALSRPLSSELPGLSWALPGRSQIVLVDRSPSMEFHDAATGVTRREAALARLEETFRQLGAPEKLVLIDSATRKPTELRNPLDLAAHPDAGPSAAAADIPGLLQTAADYIEANELGPTDIWICSDRQAGDWQADDRRWSTLRERLSKLPSIRTFLFAPPAADDFNLAVRVENVRRIVRGATAELRIDLEVLQTSGSAEDATVPLTIDVNGMSSALEVKLAGGRRRLEGYAIPLGTDQSAGVGSLTLPHDANAADNRAYFAFSAPPALRTAVVSDDEDVAAVLELAAATPRSSDAAAECTVYSTAQASQIDWENTALVLWHGPLPQGEMARRLESFVAAGKSAMFLPPLAEGEGDGGSARLFGVQWGAWQPTTQDGDPALADTSATKRMDWRREADVLRDTESGEALPVAKLVIHERRALDAPAATTIATCGDGAPLLARALTPEGGAYFLTTLPLERCSTLTDDGIVLYVAVQRALEEGARNLQAARQLTAGRISETMSEWKPQAASDATVRLSERPFQAGLYEHAGRYFAINRPSAEDLQAFVEPSDVKSLLAGVQVDVVPAHAGDVTALANELWKACVALMIVALVAEGWLSLPRTAWSRPRPPAPESEPSPTRERRMTPAWGGVS